MAADIRLTPSLHLLEPIRDWGSNATWLGYDESHCEAVAVQLGFEGSFEQQLQLWHRFRDYATGPARLASPRIARVYDCSVADDGRFFVVSERLKGRSLTRRLAESGPLPLAETGALMHQVGQALSLVHQRGFVHGGLSADNVVLLNSQRLFVKLVEIGQWGRRCPSLVSDHKPRVAHGYLAPEQVAHGRVDERTDVWALGVLAYHALTGAQPFQGDSLATLVLDIADTPCPRIPSKVRRGALRVVAHRLDGWFRRALDKDPAGRFASAEEAVTAWREAAAADHHDRDFSVNPVRFRHRNDTETVTNIAPWLLRGSNDDDLDDAETEVDEVTTLFLQVDVEPNESDIRGLAEETYFEDVG